MKVKKLTAEDLYNQIEKIFEETLGKTSSELKTIIRESRDRVMKDVRDVWDVAYVYDTGGGDVAGAGYVSRTEANKYGRLDKLNDKIKKEFQGLTKAEISSLEKAGLTIYENSYIGNAWVYNQAAGLPIITGAKAKLAAEALYSDFYGETLAGVIKKNLSKDFLEITSSITRGLNQGISYTQMAKGIRDNFNKTYSKAMTIATTEGGRIYSMAYLDSFKLLKGADFKAE